VTRRLLVPFAVLALALDAGDLPAQGALSLLGFGYPVGGLSARARGAGAATAGIDPLSPLNPAAIVLNARALVYAQFEPEFRVVDNGQGTSASTTTARFPVFGVTGRQGRVTFGLSFSTFLDRTWANSYADTQVVSGERIASTVVTQSDGGIGDARAALAWSGHERFHVGIAVHAYPGKNRVAAGRIFADSVKAGSFNLGNAFTYSGSAFSLGTVAMPLQHLVLGAEARFGGTLTMRLGDSAVVGRGRVPFHWGATLAWDGIPGSVFALRLAHDRWRDLAGLGSTALGLRDGADLGLGAEIAGPRFREAPSFARFGYRSRDLPFTYEGQAVRERALALGVGVPIAAGRTMVDIGLVRASRAAAGVTERAWQLSIGVGIRP